MKILIIGSGGREHALAWRVAQVDSVSAVWVAPGNPGTAREPKVSNISLEVTDIQGLLAFAQQKRMDLTIVGPEVPLSLGIVDRFQAAGLAIFGPDQFAAQLESSKSFSKAFMVRHQIPTAAYESFTDLTMAKDFIRQLGAPIVVKADGLAAGKGVVVAQTEEEAIAAVENMLTREHFGKAGQKVVIEEFLTGEEVSFIVMCDGEHVLPMATSQDYKRRDNYQQGPNTGGMGAHSPAPLVDEGLHQAILDQVIYPVLAGMRAEGHPYRGFLYAGLMIGPDKSIRVLEFNCRFGDPETQPIMLRFQGDLAKLCLMALKGELHLAEATWDPRCAVGVVMASRDYPDAVKTGEVIEGLPEQESPDLKVFLAGTALQDQKIVTQGGRVLCVTALGDTFELAREKAYSQVKKISWKSAFYRDDIGILETVEKL